MKNINITNLTQFSLNSFDEIVSEDRKNICDEADILVIPYKFKDDYYFAGEAINFIKYSRLNGDLDSIEIYADMDRVKLRALHSFDIWLPIVYLTSEVLFPIVVTVAASYIYDRIKGKEHEETNVKFTMIINDGNSIKEINYDGDAKTFKETFEKIDISNL